MPVYKNEIMLNASFWSRLSPWAVLREVYPSCVRCVCCIHLRGLGMLCNVHYCWVLALLVLLWMFFYVCCGARGSEPRLAGTCVWHALDKASAAAPRPGVRIQLHTSFQHLCPQTSEWLSICWVSHGVSLCFRFAFVWLLIRDDPLIRG